MEINDNDVVTKNYNDLSLQQKKIYMFQTLSEKLADFGFRCSLLDWNKDANFLAYNKDITLLIQMKTRILIDKRYQNQNIYMAFPLDSKKIYGQWCLIKHDVLVEIIRKKLNWLNTQSWEKGNYHSAKVPKEIIPDLDKYIINKRSLILENLEINNNDKTI